MILNLAVRRKLGTKAKPFMEFQIVVLEYYIHEYIYTVKVNIFQNNDEFK